MTTDTPVQTQPEFCSISALGDRVRQLRHSRGLTLSELSSVSGISVGMLSHIERGNTTPSLKTLDRIRRGLKVPLGSFFPADAQTGPEEGVVMRRADRPLLNFENLGLQKELLSPKREENLELLLLSFKPGGTSGQEPWLRAGTKAGVVLAGSLVLIVGENRWSLDTGDSFQFDSSQPHWLRNNSESDTQVLWVIKSDSVG